MSLNDLRLTRLDVISGQRKMLFALLLMFDSLIGLSYDAGLVVWSGLFNGDLVWMLQSFEMMSGGLLAIHLVLGSMRQRWGWVGIVVSLMLLIVLILGTLELLLSGLGRSALVNYNLSAVGLSGMYWTAAYLSVAAGLTLTYKVQRFGNFAQANTMLVGSYVAITLMWSDRFFPISDAPKDDALNWSLLITAAVTAFFVTGLVGIILDTLVYRRFRKKAASPQVMMIASLGIAMLIRAVLYMRFSAGTFRFVPDKDWRLASSKFSVATERLQLHLGDRTDVPLMEWASNVNPYAFTYTKSVLVIGVFASVFLLLFLLHRTRLGRRMRAVADNPELAASSGINVENVHLTSAFLSSGISGLGGALLAGVLPMNPEVGIALLLPAFAIIVLGTIGSIPGVILASIFIGLVRAGSEPLLIGVGQALDRPTMTGFAEVMPFILLVAVLLVMPRGVGDVLTRWHIDRMRGRREKGYGSTTHSFSDRVSVRPITFLYNVVRALMAYVQDVGILIIDTLRRGKAAVAVLIRPFRTLLLLRLVGASGFVMHSFTVSREFLSTNSRKIFLRQLSPSLNLDRYTERGSWIVFLILFLIILLITSVLPSASELTKVMQVARIFALLGIFGLMSFSLNLHTGITGMNNFGVIFFVGIGAVTVGILCAPVETNGYGWNPWLATLVAVSISGVAGWLLAYPTARLRMDYFAIVTISLGEMLRIALQSEPLLRAGTVTSAIGISQYARPFEGWWDSGMSETVGRWFGLEVAAPYVVLLAFMCVLFTLAIWWLLDTVLSSPWGRILRSIREDQDVSQHHGHDILKHKAASLALGAAVAAMAGALWAWLNTGIFPEFMSPVRSTFLVWAAFIVGGRGNNRGMIVGAFLIVIVEFFFNVMVVARGSESLPLHGIVTHLDNAFRWVVVDFGGYLWSDLSIEEVFLRGKVIVNLSYLKLALIGLIIIVALQLAPKGLIPEVPSRPIPSVDLRRRGKEVE